MTTLAIARLTTLEAARRRLLLAIGLLTLVVIVFLAWGFQRLTDAHHADGTRLSPVEIRLITSQLLILVTFMFSGVLALGAVLVASPSVSSEVESGISLSILARPIRRAEVILGKWLGLAVLVCAYAVASGWLAMGVIDLVTGYLPPQPFQLIAYVAAEGIVLLTLGLVLSTRLSAMTAGIIALMAFFMAWMGGIVGGIGAALNNQAIATVGTVSSLLVPSDGLWRGAIYAMEPATVISSLGGAGAGARANPFFTPAAPPLAYLAWVAFWLIAMLALALWSFRKREI